MNAETLQIFVTVAEQKNFSRAAKLLHLSQPGVSLHIRNLEQELDAKLFHRSPQQVKLTEAGGLLYERAKRILSLMEEARESIHSLQGEVTGSLKLGASFTIGEYLLPRVLAEFAAPHPRVDIEVTIGNTGEVVQGVRDNALDLGWIEGETAYPELTVEPVMQDDMILIASPDHPLALERSVPPERLNDQVWVLRELGSGTRAVSDRFIGSYDLRMQRTFVLNSSQGVKEAVAAGLGIAMLSRWTVRKELESGDVSRIPLSCGRILRDFALIQRKDAADSLAKRKFIQYLMAFAAEHTI